MLQVVPELLKMHWSAATMSIVLHMMTLDTDSWIISPVKLKCKVVDSLLDDYVSPRWELDDRLPVRLTGRRFISKLEGNSKLACVVCSNHAAHKRIQTSYCYKACTGIFLGSERVNEQEGTIQLFAAATCPLFGHFAAANSWIVPSCSPT